jgi:alkylation response protein AidB-like acyl-CoA dehydrogenase
MAEKGYLGATFPKEYGGLALDPEYYGLFTEEIGKACCSTRALFTVHTSLVGETLIKWGTKTQKEKWLPRMASGKSIAAFALSEPEVGSNAKGVQTSFKKEGGNYIINGKKKWITFANIADLFLVFASDDKGVTAFLIERNFGGIKTTPIKGLLASRAAYIAEIELNDVVVPEENIVGKINNGFNYIGNTALDYGRYSIAWGGVAIAQAALEAMVTYSRQRSQFGEKIRSFQLIQGIIGDAVTKVHAARALCLRVAEMRKRNHNDATIETTIAKYFTSKIAMEVTTDAVQVHGGNGCCNRYIVERLFREAKILEIIEGTSQIQQEIIANYGLTRYFKRKF